MERIEDIGIYNNLLITTWRATYNKRKLYNAVQTFSYTNRQFASGMQL